jgi:hypothetical protein
LAVKTLIDKLAGNAFGKEQQDFLRECSQFSTTRLAGYSLGQNYYDGQHKTRLLDRAKLILESNGIPYAENYCEVVVDTMAHKMNVTGFACEEDRTAEEWAKAYWESPANNTGEFQGIVTSNTRIKGDGFVAVEYSSILGKPRLIWNKPELCEPHYSAEDPDSMDFFVKCWETRASSVTNPNGTDIRRMNLYYPDRIEKYFAVAKGDNANWSPHIDYDPEGENGSEAWPIYYTDNGAQDGAPLGIDFFHFRNKAKGNTFGKSELRGAIPMQDAINKQVEDLFYVMDAQGWPVRYGTGIPDDQAITIAIGELLKASDPQAKFGQLDPADPRNLCQAIEASLRRFAIKTSTPVGDLLASAAASGESKKMDVEEHIAKVLDRETSDGGVWSQVMTAAYKLEGVFGEGSVDLTALPQFTTVWDDPRPRNESAETEMYATQVRDLGLSKATALTRLGYDAEAEATAKATEAEAASAAAEKAFSAGANLPDSPFTE